MTPGEEVELWRNKAKLMGTIAWMLWGDAHPVYASTAKWRGGIGGQGFTAHCSINEGPPPGQEWIVQSAFEELRDFLNGCMSADESKRITEELKEKYSGNS